MLDSKTLKISVGTITKNLEMLTFIPDHLNTKKMCKNAVKKLPFVIKYVPDQYKSKEMYHKFFIVNGGILGFIPNCNKNTKNV